MEDDEVISPVASELARSCEVDLAQTCFQCQQTRSGYKEKEPSFESFTELSMRI